MKGRRFPAGGVEGAEVCHQVVVFRSEYKLFASDDCFTRAGIE